MVSSPTDETLEGARTGTRSEVDGMRGAGKRNGREQVGHQGYASRLRFVVIHDILQAAGYLNGWWST